MTNTEAYLPKDAQDWKAPKPEVESEPYLAKAYVENKIREFNAQIDEKTRLFAAMVESVPEPEEEVSPFKYETPGEISRRNSALDTAKRLIIGTLKEQIRHAEMDLRNLDKIHLEKNIDRFAGEIVRLAKIANLAEDVAFLQKAKSVIEAALIFEYNRKVKSLQEREARHNTNTSEHKREPVETLRDIVRQGPDAEHVDNSLVKLANVLLTLETETIS